jgi:NAD(P)-dependent dehydrogenase (short-subunit alcohol dehydrogenase family)
MVTGAGQGIGKAVAARFAAEGATVVVVDRNAATVTATAQELGDAGGVALARVVDVSVRTELDALVSWTIGELGQVDVLINCAGIHQTRRFLEIEELDWDRIMGVNLRGLFFCSQAVARPMIERRSGRIVHIASIAGKRGSVHAMHYAASKAGIISLTQSMALALAPHGINVNAVCPGYVDTAMSRQSELDWEEQGLALPGQRRQASLDQIPLGRTTSPDELAALVLFLASDEAAYMTGQAINFTGGWLMH